MTGNKPPEAWFLFLFVSVCAYIKNIFIMECPLKRCQTRSPLHSLCPQFYTVKQLLFSPPLLFLPLTKHSLAEPRKHVAMGSCSQKDRAMGLDLQLAVYRWVAGIYLVTRHCPPRTMAVTEGASDSWGKNSFLSMVHLSYFAQSPTKTV